MRRAEPVWDPQVQAKSWRAMWAYSRKWAVRDTKTSRCRRTRPVPWLPDSKPRGHRGMGRPALRELLAVKCDVEYGTNLITGAKAEPLVRRADSLVS